MTAPTVTVEFFGVPRWRAGRRELTVSASTAAEAVAAVLEACPQLRGPDGCLAPHYLLSLDGTQFLADHDRPLRHGERLLLLSADAGG